MNIKKQIKVHKLLSGVEFGGFDEEDEDYDVFNSIIGA
jgi:hypothetical protein